MPAGTWSFLHESVIYEYLMFRNNHNQLRLRQVIKEGKPILKERWINVLKLAEIRDTTFPDIKGILFERDKKGTRPAEVKFVTSKFNYHTNKTYQDKCKEFYNQNGCLIVLKHDYCPKNLLEFPIDVFEINVHDFSAFARENFDRFLNRQLQIHEFKKVWLMIQSKNFNLSDKEMLAARYSGRWCPSENLNAFDLSIGDKVLFVKTKGVSKQKVSKLWHNNKCVCDDWFLEEIWIGEITLPIQSREEYCYQKSLNYVTPLWYDETIIGKKDKRVTQRKTAGIRWRRVFEFKKVELLANLNVSLSQLHSIIPGFVESLIQVYCLNVSREINIELYINLIEKIATMRDKEQVKSIEISEPYQIEIFH